MFARISDCNFGINREVTKNTMDINSALHELHILGRMRTDNLNYEEENVNSKYANGDSLLSPYPCAMASTTKDLDSALQKLGMLSSVTNSRLNYLEENAKKKEIGYSLASAPLCVVQMNPKFIKTFSLSKESSIERDSNIQVLECASKECTSRAVDRQERSYGRRKSYQLHGCMARLKRRAQNCPYYKEISKPLEDVIYFAPPEKEIPPSVSRQDSGNKSNPSSPVKSQSSVTSQGSSITRSRSLDDLETIDCPPDCYCPPSAVRTDIDTVSQSISQLHVS